MGLNLLYGLIFSLILLLAYTGKLPAQLAVIPNYDKLAHLILYAIATYLGHRTLRWRRIGRINVPVWVLLFAVLTTIEEGMQAFSPNRSLDWGDLVMSLLGVGLGYWLAERHLVLRQRR